MLRNTLVALAILIVAVFLFVGYNSYSARQHEPSDEVYSNGSALSSSNASRAASGPTQLPATAPTADTSTTPSQTAEITAAGAHTADGFAPPKADTIQPDPPNGMKFGGSGHYQLYRQGDLTWRLNTDTGETCILFATDEEWRKPKVYQAGCRGKA